MCEQCGQSCFVNVNFKFFGNMTRFARAKGSKASNERVCEEATSWAEMKNQLLQKKTDREEENTRKEFEQKRHENYQNFLKEREEQQDSQTEWAEFPNSDHGASGKNQHGKKSNVQDKNARMKKKIKGTKQNLQIDEDDIVDNACNKIKHNVPTEPTSKCNEEILSDEPGNFVRMKRKMTNSDLNQEHSTDSVTEEANISISDTTENNQIQEPLLVHHKKKFKKKKENDKSTMNITDNIVNNEASDNDAPVECSSKVEINDLVIKQKKQKQKKLKIVLDKLTNDSVMVEANKPKNNTNTNKKIDIDSLPEKEKIKILKKQERKKRQIEKKKLKKLLLKEQSEKINNLVPESTESNNGTKVRENKSKMDKANKKFDNKLKMNKNDLKKPFRKEKQNGEEHKRRKEFLPDKMMINGKEVAISYYDGFPIKKEDAQNLNQLKKGMISRGLPRSEIKKTLKLERRKAEKALAREKKKVCFNCRKFGHNLAECPDLSNKDSKELIDSSGTGICFKCGSTEHTSFACRVVDGQNFKFATCFICKEQGHISRQCPDNSRGLYPKGGSCKICGDVTHLKKDCPQFQMQQEKEQSKFQVDIIDEGNPEDMDTTNYNVAKITQTKTTSNKIVKF